MVFVGECGGLSDCEELMGVTHRRWWGWFYGGYCSIPFPFTHFLMKFTFLKYLVQFHIGPSLNSPTYFFPSGNIIFPWPCFFPSLNSPTYLSPLGKVKFTCSFFSHETRKEERRRIEMRMMSRCFIVYWLVGFSEWLLFYSISPFTNLYSFFPLLS